MMIADDDKYNCRLFIMIITIDQLIVRKVDHIFVVHVLETYCIHSYFNSLQDSQDALYWACYQRKWDVAELLLLNGADADVKNKVSTVQQQLF